MSTAPRITYVGQEYDPETGLYYYWHRWYDATTGRFLSNDPLGYAAGDVNLYRYVNNSPVIYVDPTGLAAATAIYNFGSWAASSLGGFFNSVGQQANAIFNIGSAAASQIGRNATLASFQESVTYNPINIPTNPTFCAVCHGGYGFQNLAMYGFSNEAMARAPAEQLALLDTVYKGNANAFSALFGAAEVGAGIATILGGGPAGWALGGVAVAHGLDQFATSSYNYSTGSNRDTLTIQGLQTAGLSKSQAGWVDMGIGLLDVGAGLVNVAKNLPEIATNLGNAAVKNSDSLGRLLPTGAGFSPAGDPGAAARYAAISAADDIATLAKNTGLPPNVIQSVKTHLFDTVHDIAIAPNTVVSMKFTPEHYIADLWEAAVKGKKIDDFKKLMGHEYLESTLMKHQGLPYRSADPSAWDDPLDWTSMPTKNSYGAHDLSPNPASGGLTPTQMQQWADFLNTL